MAERSLAFSPRNFVSFATNDFVDSAAWTLTVSAVITSCRGLFLMLDAYVERDFSHTAGYVVALHELLMKLPAGFVAAAEAEAYRQRIMSEKNIVRVVGEAIFFLVCGNISFLYTIFIDTQTSSLSLTLYTHNQGHNCLSGN